MVLRARGSPGELEFEGSLSTFRLKKAGQALHIMDRFHIVAKLNKAIDEVRAGEHRQMQGDGYEPVLKHSRWCLLKRRENLTEKQEAKLKDLLQYNLTSVRAYLLKEDFNGFWD